MNAPIEPRRIPLWILIPALLLPAGATWIYWSDILPKWQGVIYGVIKVLYIGLPIYCFFALEKGRFQVPRFTRSGVAWGLVTGLGILAVILGTYFLMVQGHPALADAPRNVSDKIGGFGIDTPVEFLGMALFAIIVNSSMEEFYWRWFLFGRLRGWVKWPVAALISSIGFSLHHYIVLSRYITEWTMTWWVAAFVGVGGFIWCVAYQYTRNMFSAWISHACADVAVFSIGYLLVRTAW